jgi:hypothetical protein
MKPWHPPLEEICCGYPYEHGYVYSPQNQMMKRGESCRYRAARRFVLRWDLTIEGYKVTVFEALPVARVCLPWDSRIPPAHRNI